MDAVEEMLRKQEDFEKMLAGQEDKFHMLIRETKVTPLFPSRLCILYILDISWYWDTCSL